jgi:hypothetical protein
MRYKCIIEKENISVIAKSVKERDEILLCWGRENAKTELIFESCSWEEMENSGDFTLTCDTGKLVINNKEKFHSFRDALAAAKMILDGGKFEYPVDIQIIFTLRI